MTPSDRVPKRGSSGVAAEVATRRARNVAPGSETYGAEELPVLIRLPDLAAPAAPARQRPVVSRDTASVADPLPTASPPEKAAAAPEQEEVVPAVVERDTVAERRNRRTEPSISRAPSARSQGGMGQYLMAILIAGAIFTVIVLVKESRKGSTPPVTPAAASRQIDAAGEPADFPSLPPQLNIPTPQLEPAANASSNATYAPTDTAIDLGQPVASGAVGFADGAVQTQSYTESADDYPSTNVAPVEVQSAAFGSADAAWPPAGDRPVHSADRHASDVQYQQR